MVGRSREGLRQMILRGDFLKPIHIGKRKAWPRPALLAYLGLAAAPAEHAQPDLAAVATVTQ